MWIALTFIILTLIAFLLFCCLIMAGIADDNFERMMNKKEEE